MRKKRFGHTVTRSPGYYDPNAYCNLTAARTRLLYAYMRLTEEIPACPARGFAKVCWCVVVISWMSVWLGSKSSYVRLRLGKTEESYAGSDCALTALVNVSEEVGGFFNEV